MLKKLTYAVVVLFCVTLAGHLVLGNDESTGRAASDAGAGGNTNPGQSPVSTGESVDWGAVSSAGASSSSSSYSLTWSVGEVAAGLLAGSNHTISQGFIQAFDTASGGETVLVQVISPVENDQVVPAGASIDVQFNVDMNPATINNTTFVVNAARSGRHTGTVNYDAGTRVASFTPTDDFLTGDEVFVTLTTGIQSAAGTPLAKSQSWGFRREAEGGLGTFTLDTTYQMTFVDGTSDICLADLDGDTDVDMLVCHLGDQLTVFLNNGSGEFSQANQLVTADGPEHVTAGDVDGDGDLDVITANRYSEDVSVFFNDGSGGFGSHTEYAVGGTLEDIQLSDFDADGDQDIFVLAEPTTKVLLNNGAGSFITSVDFSPLGNSYAAAVGDFDADGDQDILWVGSSSTNGLRVFTNDGQANFDSTAFQTLGGWPLSAETGDMDGDGDLDVIVGHNDPFNGVLVAFNDGSGGFTPGPLVAVAASRVNGVTSVDVDGDGDLDVAASCEQVDSLFVLVNDGAGGLSVDSALSAGQSPQVTYCADIDQDGDLDIAAANYNSRDVFVYLNENSGCCVNLTGNTDGDAGDVTDVGDLTYIIAFLFLGGPEPLCPEEGNIDGAGAIDVGDLTALIGFLFLGGASPAACP